MKQLVMISAAALLLAACSEKPGYQISGKVNNPALEGKNVYLCAVEEGTPVLDSALVQNGSFMFKGVQDQLALRKLKFSEADVEPMRAIEGEDAPFSVTLALDNSKLQVALDTLSDVGGSVANDAVKTLKTELRTLRDKQESLVADMKSEDEAVTSEAVKKAEAIEEEISEKVAAFIKGNIDNPLSGKLFYDFRYNISEDTQYQIADVATDSFRAIPGVTAILDRLEKMKSVAVGQKFADLELNDVKGKPGKLSDYVGKGKVVLIDFWASWCPPCRKETPKLVELYKQYKNKGFEIVGVSFDSKQEAWKKGIKDLGITWPQLSDLKGWKSVATSVYYVNSIPHTIIVDKDGTIVARNVHGDAIGEKLSELLDK